MKTFTASSAESEDFKDTATPAESELVTEIEKYLKTFGDQSLCDGDAVRDALLDLRNLAIK